MSYMHVLQVDPLTHQVKLCDFGSAKVLVCSSPTCSLFLLSKRVTMETIDLSKCHTVCDLEL